MLVEEEVHDQPQEQATNNITGRERRRRTTTIIASLNAQGGCGSDSCLLDINRESVSGVMVKCGAPLCPAPNVSLFSRSS